MTDRVTSIAGYRIVRRIGEGGMGVVYEAEQPHPRRRVALKVIRAGRHASDTQVRMFRREIEALARLKHEGIASIYEAGATEDDQPFFTMELVKGQSLADYIAANPLAPGSNLRRRLTVFLKICAAISYAHQRGVIHRDLKPTNVFLVDDETTRSGTITTADRIGVKILDFGLARTVDAETPTTLMTEAGQIKGTLPYMSPEQVRGATDEIDVRRSRRMEHGSPLPPPIASSRSGRWMTDSRSCHCP